MQEEPADGGAEDVNDSNAAPNDAAPALGNQPAQSETPAAGEEASCEELCPRCGWATGALNCADFCSQVLADVTVAGCSSALESVLQCRLGAANACAENVCPTNDNALTACILDYCEGHPGSGACTAPL